MRDRIFLYPDVVPGETRVSIKQLGTLDDLKRLQIELKEGQCLPFYCHDADDAGRRDDLIFEGTIHRDAATREWYVVIDESTYRSSSGEM